ncbi:hypothetical protein ACQP2P_28090 [Dactylosporangium sp. CA-139114]|uniref:hypothetical protein n=1 Tax=Dactylosporangium sp. CA-139114 TaxID=3239931 RepID=UPI003D9645E5
MWSSGHYREAVSAPARAVNAFTQTKVDRRDVSETNLSRRFSPWMRPRRASRGCG